MPLSQTGKHVVNAPAQIGIEVSVYQPDDYRRRNTAPKDVVIWREASGTCWDAALAPVCTPLAVIEWKVRHPKAPKKTLERATQHDRGWLRGFTNENEGTLGYSVYLEWTSKWAPGQLVVARCQSGKWNNEWFVRS